MSEINLAHNLADFRNKHNWTIEEIAEKIGVSRQAIAKWENGASMPDIINCAKLANLYDVPIDELLYFNGEEASKLPEKGKYYFGTIKINEKGQITLPPKAREMYKISTHNKVVLLGNEIGLALIPENLFMSPLKKMMQKLWSSHK
ncbi:helix-turn-helix domain-containing protein [Limosilactobacillus reuteri]|uniref:helix-turn-helix domain-containing protein n=1 Tax=Limosilactobacillus reuteri TaxID=1598 RepID=UPI001E5354D9|nr:helix-turn-helix domain-containing protein [Limosilactobacillus reuteri]MCC4382381.1 helix-turn-helix domain-containing protein [Limosilactobacillus reuteri]MCC4419824.1 helix-turn-helix domain-containing protein [Limosilactobacillus reuteri]